MRTAFGMIQVIFFILILSGLLTITMKYATLTSKQTANLYTNEQAQLFMSSSIELALLGISSTDTKPKEIEVISDDKRFIADINITKYYTQGFVDMEIVVETNNTHPKISKPIRLTRRSLQRL